MYSTSLISSGSYLPPKILTNLDLEKVLSTSDEWIFSRTGIKQRHIAENETTSEMAIKASKIAIEKAGLQPDQIDLIIVATTTPDYTFPSTAALVQEGLNIKKEIPFFDIQAVCSGFVYAMTIADNFIKLGQATNVLVVGVDRMSKILDWQDRSTCILFGDGAGAVILQQKDQNFYRRIIATKLSGNGSLQNILKTSGGPGSNATTGFIQMKGKEVFKIAVEKLSENILDLLKVSQIDVNKINVVIPHQANVRIIESVTNKINIPKEKVVITLDKHANTSAASIPLALDFYINNNNNSENLAILSGIGGGMTWGGLILRF